MNQQPAQMAPKSNLKWLLIILAIVIIGGALYYFLPIKGKTSTATNSTSPSPKISTSASISPSASATATPTANASATNVFSLANLKSATVVISSVNYPLTDGTYTHPGVGPFDPEVPSTITLDSKNITVDSADANQAAVILAVGGMRHAGATVNFNELEIMTNSSGTPKYVASILINDYYQSTINNISFAANLVTLNFTPAGGTSKTAIYKLANGTLTLQ